MAHLGLHLGQCDRALPSPDRDGPFALGGVASVPNGRIWDSIGTSVVRLTAEAIRPRAGYLRLALGGAIVQE
jgi:hypothetical protein